MTLTADTASASAQEDRVVFDDSRVSSAGIRSTARRGLFWVIIAVLVIVFATVTLVLTGSTQDTNRLSATNPHTNGAEALVNVLRADGVAVSTPNTLAAAAQAASRNPGTTTLVVYDQNSILSTSQYRSLVSAAAQVILIEPNTAALDAFAPGVDHAGALASTTRSAHCAYPPAEAAQRVSGLAVGYRVSPGTAGAVGCFGTGGVFALVRVATTNQAVTVLGATATFTNEYIRQNGNAAFALRMFGAKTHLVWYLPTLADSTVPQDGVIPNPPWVPWAIVLAGIVLVAAGVWRGRRFGPVVIERMPVFVRASETLEGRSRLYQRSSARTHALDALRIGALGRLSSTCGLPARAGVDEVIGAVARLTGRSYPDLRALLVDALPATDAHLLRLSDDVARLEADVSAAVR